MVQGDFMVVIYVCTYVRCSNLSVRGSLCTSCRSCTSSPGYRLLPLNLQAVAHFLTKNFTIRHLLIIVLRVLRELAHILVLVHAHSRPSLKGRNDK